MKHLFGFALAFIAGYITWRFTAAGQIPQAGFSALIALLGIVLATEVTRDTR